MTKVTLPLSVVLFLGIAAPPTAAQSALPTLVGVGATSFAFTGGVNDVAFNDKAGVYLHVWGHPAVWGAFVNANGVTVGAPFLIAAQSGSDAWPRVSYSKGTSDDVFLVVFTSEIVGQRLYARLVKYNPAAPGGVEMGAVQPISNSPALNRQITGGIAFNASKRQFFVTWEDYRLGQVEVFGQVWQLSGTAAAPTIAAATDILNISNSPNGQGTPNIAYDYQHNNYMVVYRGQHPANGLIAGSWAKTVAFDSAMTPSFSGVITLTSGLGEPAEQNVVYAPEVDRYLTFWTEIGVQRDLHGVLVDHNGAPAGGVFPIMATGSNEGAADADYNPTTRTIFMAAMRDQTRYAQGVMLTGVGSIIEYFQATSVLPAPNAIETMYPQVVAASSGRFGVSYINGFQFGYVDVWQGGVAGSPGPAPAPSCAVEPLPGTTTRSLTGAAQSQTISVTASTADCAWTAAPSASWITITAGASGAGPGTTTFAVARNSSGAARTGTISIGSGAVTISQAAAVGSAAVHDISGDRASDLMWHNVSTGSVAAWNLDGHVVTNMYHLATVNTNWKVMGTGDLNGDGFADIVWRHSGGAVACWSLRNGQIQGYEYLTLNGSTAVEADPTWEIRAVGDLDGDGFSDVVWQNVGGSGVLGVWFMEGARVREVKSFNVGMLDTTWRIAGAGDLNADGKADIIWQNDSNGMIGAWLMDGAIVAAQSNLSVDRVTDTRWKIRGVGDTNGDGFADVLWQHTATGQLAVWYMNNFTVVGARLLTLGVADPDWRVVGPG